MKRIFIFLFFVGIILLSCCSTTQKVDNAEPTYSVDTLIIESVRIDTVTVVDSTEIERLAKRLEMAEDSLKFYRDSIRYEDYANARRIEKIKYYISICEKKSTNKKFFYGWIKRTMSE